MDIETIASEVLTAARRGEQITPFSSRIAGFDLPAAYRVADEIRARRVQQGERALGRKIGFTNRTIWAEYGVWAPIFGYVYDRTVSDVPDTLRTFPLAGLAEPRIEPEIIFGLASAPTPGMDEGQLLNCIDWIAHGFEIVQSIFPGWKFAAADTVAAFGLHGALLIGARHKIATHGGEWQSALRTFDIELLCDGVVRDRGRAANVLDGPLFALSHLTELLANDPARPALAVGDIVTTGTLTRALPVAAGETWSTVLHGIALPGVQVRFA
jgi:2-oxo-3-hexenedioate decarboxylase